MQIITDSDSKVVKYQPLDAPVLQVEIGQNRYTPDEFIGDIRIGATYDPATNSFSFETDTGRILRQNIIGLRTLLMLWLSQVAIIAGESSVAHRNLRQLFIQAWEGYRRVAISNVPTRQIVIEKATEGFITDRMAVNNADMMVLWVKDTTALPAEFRPIIWNYLLEGGGRGAGEALNMDRDSFTYIRANDDLISGPQILLDGDTDFALTPTVQQEIERIR